MSGRWIDAVALVGAAHAERFQRVVERSVSGLDATYLLEEHLHVEFGAEEDVALFRLALLEEATACEILRVAELRYLVSPRLSDDVRGHIDQGLFEAAAVPLTVARLEMRDEGVLRRLRQALGPECPALTDQLIPLCTG